MRIDRETGAFSLDDGTALSPALTRAAFLASPVGKAAAVAAQLEPWLTLDFELREERVAVTVLFEGEQLRTLSFASTDPRFGDAWDEWSEGSERERARHTERWLEGHGLAAGVYAWGSVWAGFEPRSGEGRAVVTFERWH